jgi:uncharacterized glyoxalase superfamily protein PhnB
MKLTGESGLYRTASISSSVYYRDPRAAMAWLQDAFGLEIAHLVEDDSGDLTHIELGIGDSVLTVAAEWTDWAKSPAHLAGGNTQSLRVTLEGNLDAHFARAVAAGARVIQPPEDQAYQQRTYRVLDYEGHAWSFATNLPAAPTRRA